MSEAQLIKDIEADERLRDAAPDMLAALKAATSEETAARVEELINVRHGGDCTILEAMELAFELVGARAAIAKAEGRS